MSRINRFGSFLIKAGQELENTLFIIYGDHSNTLSKKEYEKIYQRELSDLEYRKILSEVATIIYDTSGKINNYLKQNHLNKKDITSRTLSQIDLFATVVSAYNLSSEHLLGVDMFSNKKSFAIDPKGLDIVTDSFYYSLKDEKYVIYDNTNYNKMMEQVEDIKKFKLANDYYLFKQISS